MSRNTENTCTTDTQVTVTREQLHEAFIKAWALSRPWHDVADTKLAWELCRALGLEKYV